jgi:hypothetical protein
MRSEGPLTPVSSGGLGTATLGAVCELGPGVSGKGDRRAFRVLRVANCHFAVQQSCDLNAFAAVVAAAAALPPLGAAQFHVERLNFPNLPTITLSKRPTARSERLSLPG